MDNIELLRVARTLAQRYSSRFKIDIDDAESECIAALLQAANMVDPEREGSLWGYYDIVCRRQMQDYGRKLARWRRNARLRCNEPTTYTVEYDFEHPSHMYDRILWGFLADGYTIAELAHMYGMSHMEVRQHIYRAVYEARGEDPVYIATEKNRVVSPFKTRIRSFSAESVS